MPRIDFPGARHHVMNRASRRAEIFPTPAAPAVFLELLAVLPERFGVDVQAYALMSNHYHLMVTSHRGTLSRAMRFLGAEYTRRLNAAQGWDGPLFRGRFKNRVVESDEDWRYLLLYLHANPVRAGLTPAEAERWTSHCAYVGRGDRPEWLETSTLLRSYGGPFDYAQAWRRHVGGDMEPPPRFAATKLWSWQPSGQMVQMPKDDGVFDVANCLAQAAEVTGTALDDLSGPVGAGKRVPARWLVAWWLSRRQGVAHARIAAAFGVGHDAVSRDIRRFEQRRHSDERFAAWVVAMEKVSSV